MQSLVSLNSDPAPSRECNFDALAKYTNKLGKKMSRLTSLCLTLVFILLSAGGASAQEKQLIPPGNMFIYIVIGGIFLTILMAIHWIRKAVSNSAFSLAEALSEESQVPLFTDGQTKTLVKDDKGNPIFVPKLVSSSSRVIALTGCIVLVLLFVGFGVFVMYYFAMGKGLPDDIDKVTNFLYAGLTLFAPYLVNKFSGLFDATPKKAS